MSSLVLKLCFRVKSCLILTAPRIEGKLKATLGNDGSYSFAPANNPESFVLHSGPAFFQADKMMHSTEDGSLKLAGKFSLFFYWIVLITAQRGIQPLKHDNMELISVAKILQINSENLIKLKANTTDRKKCSSHRSTQACHHQSSRKTP